MLKEKAFKTSEVSLNYAEGPNKGPPILFLHGLTDSWQFFQPGCPSLTLRWQVYAPTFRDHEASSHTPTNRSLDHINDAIAFIENVIGKTTHIYGTALGGIFSLMFGARRSDLVKTLVSGTPISNWKKFEAS
jgi:pimeloyl-ACP methyl ester carboxylesterase